MTNNDWITGTLALHQSCQAKILPLRIDHKKLFRDWQVLLREIKTVKSQCTLLKYKRLLWQLRTADYVDDQLIIIPMLTQMQKIHQILHQVIQLEKPSDQGLLEVRALQKSLEKTIHKKLTVYQTRQWCWSKGWCLLRLQRVTYDYNKRLSLCLKRFSERQTSLQQLEEILYDMQAQFSLICEAFNICKNHLAHDQLRAEIAVLANQLIQQYSKTLPWCTSQQIFRYGFSMLLFMIQCGITLQLIGSASSISHISTSMMLLDNLCLYGHHASSSVTVLINKSAVLWPWLIIASLFLIMARLYVPFMTQILAPLSLLIAMRFFWKFRAGF